MGSRVDEQMLLTVDNQAVEGFCRVIVIAIGKLSVCVDEDIFLLRQL